MVADEPRSRETEHFSAEAGRAAERKLRAQRRNVHGVWFGFAMFGLIGWSVVVPTLLGAAVGVWLDRHHPVGTRSWTLALMVAGLILGCVNAWRWVTKEHRALEQDQTDTADESKQEQHDD